MGIRSVVFKSVLMSLLKQAQEKKKSHLDIISGQLHRIVGGYPGKHHAMPTCCAAMKKLMKVGDLILVEPPKGKGATLKIRYILPRYDIDD